MKSHSKILIFTTLDTWRSNFLATQKIDKISRCNEESNGNKYLTLVPSDEIKGTKKSIGTTEKNQWLLITWVIMMKNIWKTNLIWMINYF